ncbi:hypothetical protein EV421DRAFT_1811056 [Armillaria borealis]|uniref:Uncharacterized protein n=1 Tax=Armillaria borealis TaxID=47425 RepID=A0AA39JGF4_9AGAR|nr:hypothetical protein EV421DRAFT_1811055 [Armillaria borealis]KAK0441964.1 hypothetical protein EV421DRAFT_1811056 [Armillaria borealis]
MMVGGRIMRILNSVEDAPGTDNASETDSQIYETFFAKIPGPDKFEEDAICVPVMRIDHLLSNVLDPSQLCGDLDLFKEIIQEYRLAHFGSAAFPQLEPEIDNTRFPDNFSVYSSMSTASGTSTEDLDSDSPDSHAPDLSLADEYDVSSNPPAPAPLWKGKLRVKSLFRRAITNLAEFLKEHKFSTKS